jgi:hypothetical protein
MITFHSQQSDCARRTRKNENTGTFNLTSQIAPSICTVVFTKCEKSHVTIFTSRCSRTSLFCIFRQGQALPLSQAKVFRLAHISPIIARSPARRSSDGCEPSGKTSGKLSRVMSAQCPGNGRSVAAAMPPSVRQDGLQDNLRHAGVGRAMVAPGTCETTRKMVAQQPCRSPQNGQCNIWQADSSESHRHLSTMTFKNYEHTNQTNTRS